MDNLEEKMLDNKELVARIEANREDPRRLVKRTAKPKS